MNQLLPREQGRLLPETLVPHSKRGIFLQHGDLAKT